MNCCDLKVLDCTLRDGGYINDWNFGKRTIINIFMLLENANIDIIELGFLRDEEENIDRTVWKQALKVKDVIKNRKTNTETSLMILHDKYDIRNLEPSSQTGIDIIRVTFHQNDYTQGIEYAKKVQSLGYKVSCNPINIMGYSNEEIENVLNLVNELNPYAFSVVDTFGSMEFNDLNRIIEICDTVLNPGISIGLHLHENKAMSFSLAQHFINMNINRPCIIDGSLNGMGRVPGNLPIELLTNYLNQYQGKAYEIDYLLDAIEEYIEPIKHRTGWGYSPMYFLSAKYNLHRNYAEFFLDKGNLTHKDINHLLSAIPSENKAIFDESLAEGLYIEYMKNDIDDTDYREKLTKNLSGKDVLVVAPGKTISEHGELLDDCIKKGITTIGINFVPSKLKLEYVFLSNSKRVAQYDYSTVSVISTSNLHIKSQFVCNINQLKGTEPQGDNSLIMLLRLLKESGVKKVMLAGADGYTSEGLQYCERELVSYRKHTDLYNIEMREAIKRLNMSIEFITPSYYE